MKTNLELVKSGYVGLQVAHDQVRKVLHTLTSNTPIQFNLHQSDVESVITFMGNGLVTTIHTQVMNPERKGGVR